MKQAYTIVVIGAGTAGISLAAHLLRHAPVLTEQVAIIDPAQTHYFQPLWTFAGLGLSKRSNDEKAIRPHSRRRTLDTKERCGNKPCRKQVAARGWNCYCL